MFRMVESGLPLGKVLVGVVTLGIVAAVVVFSVGRNDGQGISGTHFLASVANNAFAPLNDPAIGGVGGVFSAQSGAVPTLSSATSGTERPLITGGKQVDVFFAADQANVDAVIPATDGGTCTIGGAVSTCPGIASTKALYAVGRLAIFSCAGAWSVGGAATSSPACKASPVVMPDGGAPDTIRDVVDLLVDLTDRPTFKLSLADPDVAPYGFAARQALTANNGAGPVEGGGTGITASQFNDFVATGRIVLAIGITGAKTNVSGNTNGTQVGLIAVSSVARVLWSPAVTAPPYATSLASSTPDPNPWKVVDQPGNYAPIDQYAVAIRRSTPDAVRQAAAQAFISFVRGQGQVVLGTYGYTHI